MTIKPASRSKEQNITLNAVDLEIMRLLQEDGRQSYARIAGELGLSPSTVQHRANRLIDSGVLSIKALVHPTDLQNTMLAMVAIRADGTKLQQVADAISRLPEVRWVVICTGQYDILSEVVCPGAQGDLLSLLSEKIACIDGIREMVTFPYLQVTKRTTEWAFQAASSAALHP